MPNAQRTINFLFIGMQPARHYPVHRIIETNLEKTGQQVPLVSQIAITVKEGVEKLNGWALVDVVYITNSYDCERFTLGRECREHLVPALQIHPNKPWVVLGDAGKLQYLDVIFRRGSISTRVALTGTDSVDEIVRARMELPVRLPPHIG